MVQRRGLGSLMHSQPTGRLMGAGGAVTASLTHLSPLILKEASLGIMASQDSKTVKVDAARLLMPRTGIFVTLY